MTALPDETEPVETPEAQTSVEPSAKGRHHPWIAGLVLALVLASTAHTQLNNLLQGMHVEGVDGANISTLTGSYLGPSNTGDIDTALETWSAWDVPQETGATSRIHESPQSIVGIAIGLDYLFIIPGYFFVLLFVARSLRRKLSAEKDRSDLRMQKLQIEERAIDEIGPEAWNIDRDEPMDYADELSAARLAAADAKQNVEDVDKWLDAVAWIKRATWVAALADVVENALILTVVNVADAPGLAKVALVVAARAKWYPLLFAVLASLYVAALRPDETGRRWVTDLPAYLRGLRAIRVPVISVILTAFIVYGPLLADQMRDVIRRWTLLHFLVTLLFVGLVATFVGVQASSLRLRLVTKTPRWSPDERDRSALDLTASEAEARNREFWKNGKASSARAAKWIAGAGVVGLAAQWAFGFGAGLVVPAAFIVALWALGLPLPQRIAPLATATGRPRTVSERAPRFAASLVPLIIGLGIITAVVPEYALDESRANPWPVVASLLFIPLAALAFRAVMKFAAELASHDYEHALERVGRDFFRVVSALIVILAIWLATSKVPAADGAMSFPWLLLLGVGFVTAAHFIYYFFAEPVPLLDEEGLPRPMPSIIIPGTKGWKRDARAALRIVVLATTVLMVLWILLAPITGPRIIGGLGFAMGFVWILSLLFEWVSRFVERSAPPKVLEYLGVQRTPAILLGVAWIWVVATVPALNEGFHDVDVEVASEESAAARDVTIEDVWNRFIENNGLSTLEDLEANASSVIASGAEKRQAQPMLFVSAWGGGIRAAVWTAYVLDCALEPHADGTPWIAEEAGAATGPCRTQDGTAGNHVVAMSGISGGSLGFAEYLAQRTQADPDPTVSHGWVADRLSQDFLAPSLARLFYVDIPVALVGGSDRYRDRADMLQEAWEEAWPDRSTMQRGILDLWAQRPDLPLAIMNGTSVKDGCSINTSPLRANRGNSDHALECTTLGPFDAQRPGATGEPADLRAADFAGSLAATHDVAGFLCDEQDLSLSAAALMSARFPLISPTGRLKACAPDGGLPDQIFTTDGGQLELSGTLTATQMWEALEPYVTRWNALNPQACIAPVLIHMENGFSEDRSSSSTKPPNEWIDPNLWSLTSAKGGLIDNARQREALEFSEPLAGLGDSMALFDGADEVERFVYIRTRAHPGAAAPLGWTLSETTIKDLAAQLGQNDAEFATVGKWLSGGLECGPAVAQTTP